MQNLFAQLPQSQLFSIFPPGGKQGETVEIKVTDGKDLEELESLYFSHPGITAKLANNSKSKGNRAIGTSFQVKIGSDVPPGIYDVRVNGFFGVSNPRSFVVGDLKELAEKEPNDQSETANLIEVNSTVNGTIQKASDVDCFVFEGKKGQALILDCFCARIDSPMVAVLQVFSPEGRRLVHSRDEIRGDPLASVVLPSDGKYIVKVFDLAYRGGKQSHYRVSLHTKPYIDFILPPSGVAGSTSTYTLFGRNLPNGQPTEFRIGATPLQKVNVQITLPAIEDSKLYSTCNRLPHEMGMKSYSYSWNSSAGLANPHPVFISQNKPKLGSGTAEKKISVPGEFVGHFETTNDVDSFRFTGKTKKKYAIEVFGHRLGSPTDPFLLVEQVIKDKAGKETFKRITYKGETPVNSSIGGTFFNTQNDDPYYLMTAPADAEYRVSVHDLGFQTYGDPRAVYRVTVKESKPDFHLVALPLSSSDPNKGAAPSSIVLRKGSSTKISVMIDRKIEFNYAVELSVRGLPDGVYCTGTSIGANEKSATLVIESKADAKTWAGDIQVVGKVHAAEIEANAILNVGERIAQTATILRATPNMNTPAHARSSRGLLLSVINETSPFQVVHSVNSIGVRQGEKVVVPLQVLKRDKFDDKVAINWSGIPRRSKITAKNTTVEKGKKKKTIEVVIGKDTPAGIYAVNLETSSTISYQRNPSARERANQAVQLLSNKLKAISTQESKLKKAKPPAAEELKQLLNKKKTLQAEKKAADANLVAVKKATASKKITHYANSSPVVIRVKPLPFEASLSVPAKGVVKQGATVNVSLKLKRKNNFKGAVQVEFLNANKVKGFEASSAGIPVGKSDSVLVLKLAKESSIGTANFQVRLKSNFEGDYTVNLPLDLKITK